MIERASTPKETPVPLSIAAGQRIVMPGMDSVLGWIGGESGRAAQALVFPHWLLEPRPAETIAYACNLPLRHRALTLNRACWVRPIPRPRRHSSPRRFQGDA